MGGGDVRKMEQGMAYKGINAMSVGMCGKIRDKKKTTQNFM